MLSGHPDIDRTYVRETYTDAGRMHQTLIVETKLRNPARGDRGDWTRWEKLQRYLVNLSANDFADFHSVELLGMNEKNA